jgi:dihydrofolate reductase
MLVAYVTNKSHVKSDLKDEEDEMATTKVTSNVFSGLAVSVDGFITGRDPRPGRGLGDGGMLHDWYFDGDTPSQLFDGFKLYEPSRRVFDEIAGRVGAVVAGRNAYDDAQGWGGGGPHPTAPLFVVSHSPAPPEATDMQTFVTSIEEGIDAARAAAGDGDVALMGGGVVTSALRAGLLDEVILHQVPVLLGAGHSFFQQLPEHVELSLVEAVPAPGVTHLHYRVER